MHISACRWPCQYHNQKKEELYWIALKCMKLQKKIVEKWKPRMIEQGRKYKYVLKTYLQNLLILFNEVNMIAWHLWFSIDYFYCFQLLLDHDISSLKIQSFYRVLNIYWYFILLDCCLFYLTQLLVSFYFMQQVCNCLCWYYSKSFIIS